MREAEATEFDGLMETLALWYRQPKPEANEVIAYFNQLKHFALSIVEEAIQRSPGAHPDWFPKVGELLVICQQVVGGLRNEKDNHPTNVAIYKMANCEHEWREEPEPEGGWITSFNVCVRCTKALPVFSRDPRFTSRNRYIGEAGLSKAIFGQ